MTQAMKMKMRKKEQAIQEERWQEEGLPQEEEEEWKGLYCW